MNEYPLTRQKWEKQIRALWPAIKGSVALVSKPCIRKSCPACARGDNHPAWLLSFTLRGKRKTMYVPLSLVRTLKRALHNGRKIEKLLYQTGPALLKQHRLKSKNDLKQTSKS
jgi:hypothetical protein